jgi:hypothetical protein
LDYNNIKSCRRKGVVARMSSNIRISIKEWKDFFKEIADNWLIIGIVLPSASNSKLKSKWHNPERTFIGKRIRTLMSLLCDEEEISTQTISWYDKTNQRLLKVILEFDPNTLITCTIKIYSRKIFSPFCRLIHTRNIDIAKCPEIFQFINLINQKLKE